MTPDANHTRRPPRLARLARWLGFGQARLLDETTQAVVSFQESVVDLAEGLAAGAREAREALTTLQAMIAQLEKKTNRVGREQFKANAVNEATQQHIRETLQRLREVEQQRDKELAALRERLARRQAGERLKVVERLFPALDGLHESLLSGKRALDQMALPAVAAPPARGMAERIQAARDALLGRPLPAAQPPDTKAQRATLAAWLAGVTIVHERLLAILEHEAVSPIEAVGKKFDPAQHQAVEVTPAVNGVAAGQVVRELRRGYVKEGIVLRYAEVVVARDLGPDSRAAPAASPAPGGASAEVAPAPERDTEQ